MRLMFSEKSKWIGLDDALRLPVRVQSPAMQLRRSFFYSGAEQAECLICGLGAYILYINGKRVNNDVLSPAFTAYDIRTLYMHYDVTAYLQKGENVIAVKLGDGFYNQTTEDNWSYHTAPWRNTPRLRFELFADGETVVASDLRWLATRDGATVHNAVREGEYYDARKESAWCELAYDAEGWQGVCLVRAPGGELALQTMPPIRECEVLQPVAVWRSKNGFTYDFGQNIAGYVGLRMRGKAGQTVTFRYAERLDGAEIDQTDVSIYVKTDCFQQDRYTFRGVGVEEWRPEFVYHGFQYVEVSGVDEQPEDGALTAYFVHTDLQRKGDFSCSDELLSWIYRAGIYSFLGNYHGIPTDCPHREKNGWTGDAALSCGYATFFYEMREAYKKYILDIADSQRRCGQICSIVPTAGSEYNWGTGPAWDSALFIIPYTLYLETGDSECMRIAYPYAKKYLEYAKDFEIDGLVCYGLSDWCPPRCVERSELMSNRFSDSCYYYAMIAIGAKMAEMQGELQLARVYRDRAAAVQTAIRATFVNGDSVDTNGQGALATALYFRIVEGTQAQDVAKRLVATLKKDGYKLKVGILGMKSLLNALSDYGYTAEAYRLVAQSEYPSYGYWRSLGMTTFGERWEGDASRNHHMYGEVLHWLARHIAGVQNAGIGYDACVLKPYLFADTCSASCQTETPNGRLSFAWERSGSDFLARIVIPAGVQAHLLLDGQAPILLEQGTHEIKKRIGGV